MVRSFCPAGAVCAVLALLAPAPVLAHSLSLTLWPSDDPETVRRCAVHLDAGRMRVVQAQGPGVGERVAVWAPTSGEEAVLMAALAAFVAGDLPSVGPTDPAQPAPPFVTVNWITRLDGQVLAGRSVAPGLDLPPVLAAVVARLMPGSLCDLG